MKAQISMEFMAFMAIMLIILLIASYSAISSSVGISKDNRADDARKIASAVAGEINIASEVGDGYSRTFTIPTELFGGANYSISISGNIIYVSWEGRSYPLPVIANNVTGNINKGSNSIKNINGVIYFG